MGISGLIVVGDDDDVRAAQALAVFVPPFLFLLWFDCTTRAASGRHPDLAKVLNVFLALDNDDHVLAGDGLEQFGQPVEDLANIASLPNPTAFAIGLALWKRLVGVAANLKQEFAVLIDVVVDRDKRVGAVMAIGFTTWLITRLPLRQAELCAHMIAAHAPVVAGMTERDETVRGCGGQSDSQRAVARRMARARRQHLLVGYFTVKSTSNGG